MRTMTSNNYHGNIRATLPTTFKLTTLLVMLLLCATATAKEFGKKELAQLVMGRQADNTPPAPPEDMLVIGAGLGRTGTTSFLEAMKRLGLKSYHMVEGVTEAPGHAALWEEQAHNYSQNGVADVDKIMDKMAADGFNATTDFPACLIYKELLDRYPNARVVLTVRNGGGTSWADSVLDTIWLFIVATLRKPIWWIPELRAVGQVMLHWALPMIGVPIDLQHNGGAMDPDAIALAKAYDNWIVKVKRDVPEDKLLIFQPKDGWKPLCEFLSPVTPSIQQTCQEILATNEPYPFVNDKAKLKFMVSLLNTIANVFEYVLPLLAIVAIAYFTIGNKFMVVKTKTSNKQQQQQEKKKV